MTLDTGTEAAWAHCLLVLESFYDLEVIQDVDMFVLVVVLDHPLEVLVPKQVTLCPELLVVLGLQSLDPTLEIAQHKQPLLSTREFN